MAGIPAVECRTAGSLWSRGKSWTIAQDETIYITLGIGDEQLYFKADAQGDTFDIEI